MFSIRSGVADDWEDVRGLLSDADLPVADLDAGCMERFMIAETAQGDVIGAIGMDAQGDVALLRSLVITAEARAGGVGRALVERLEALAVSRGVREVWLLTIDADGYFARLGYETRSRAEAPPAILATDEFTSLCPASAVLMRRRI
ncbi:MAG: arsenic resistance N-acetyltransferase ArsN2 [Pseudomonadota bacterium]